MAMSSCACSSSAEDCRSTGSAYRTKPGGTGDGYWWQAPVPVGMGCVVCVRGRTSINSVGTGSSSHASHHRAMLAPTLGISSRGTRRAASVRSCGDLCLVPRGEDGWPQENAGGRPTGSFGGVSARGPTAALVERSWWAFHQGPGRVWSTSGWRAAPGRVPLRVLLQDCRRGRDGPLPPGPSHGLRTDSEQTGQGAAEAGTRGFRKTACAWGWKSVSDTRAGITPARAGLSGGDLRASESQPDPMENAPEQGKL